MTVEQMISDTLELTNYLRLCFVHYEAEQIREGILRLQACLSGNAS